MFGWRRKVSEAMPVVEAVAESAVPETGSQDEAQDQYLSDQPITRRAQDRFSRAPFANRIAETIAKRSDPSSIVIGLYGFYPVFTDGLERDENC